MKTPLIDKIEKEQLKAAKDVPDFREGDTVNVHVVIKEGDKERVQQYKGTVIARDRGTSGISTFTVRRVSMGEGVERVFPLHSPHVAKIEVTRRGSVRRAKLYYLRKLTGKKARISEASRTVTEKAEAAARAVQEAAAAEEAAAAAKAEAEKAAAEKAAAEKAAAEAAEKEAAEKAAAAEKEAAAAAEAAEKEAAAAAEAAAAPEAAAPEADAPAADAAPDADAAAE